MRRLLISALAAVCLVPVQGSTLQRMSLNDIIGKSTLIVQATVQPTYSALRGAVIYTHFQVQVSNTYKGSSVNNLDLAVPGGAVNGAQQSFAGAPTLTAGQNYLLFLWTSKTGLTQVIGLSQGLFYVSTNTAGQLIVSRAAASATMLNASGQTVTDSSLQMTLAEMVSRIQTVLAGGGQ